MRKDEVEAIQDEVGTTNGKVNPSCGSIFLVIFVVLLTSLSCGLKAERNGIPADVEALIETVTDDIAQERYEKIYDESSELWKHDSTLEQSEEVFKRLRTKLGKIESRTLNSATEEHNSGGALKGHAFIVTYQTKFERGEGMETFTLLEQNGHWLLARYFATSTALK
jgi:Protein of unknown function (DUF4019)/Protein of unknown function (DUF3887)